MAEPKPIASLSSGLLARKGAARPAMRRQGLGQGLGMGGMMSHPLPDVASSEWASSEGTGSEGAGSEGAWPEGAFAAQDDLGWNDMGYDVDPAHEEHAPDYGNLLAGAIPAAPPDAHQPVPAVEAQVPDVVRQRAEIAARMAEPVAGPAPEPAPEPAPAAVLATRKRPKAAPVKTPVPAVSSGRRAAFTLRLDAERHLRLRLASAITGQSAQQLVTAALDELLTKIPEIEDLAGRVPRPAER